MVSIVLASHGDLAAGIKQTGSMVFGDQPSVAVVSLEPSMGPDDFRAKVEEAIASFEDQEQVLFLVDLWGGTPFNQISGLIEGHDSWAIVTGATCLCSSRHIRSALTQRTLHMRSQNIS